MKNIIFLAVTIFSSAVFIISCGGSEDLKSSDIVGIWQVASNTNLTGTCYSSMGWDEGDSETDYWYFVSAGSNVITVYTCCIYDENDNRTCDVSCKNIELIGSYELKGSRLSFGIYNDKRDVSDSDDYDCYFKESGESYIEFESEEKAKYIMEENYQIQGSECWEISDYIEEEYGDKNFDQCLQRFEILMTRI